MRKIGALYAARIATVEVRLHVQHQEGEYMDTRLIVPTSTISEQLFSASDFALSDRRKYIIPVSFEINVFS